uniref:Protein Wnt n=1 Tax=Aceria tosichella TaxID=561515 RepID=A0A6G1SCG7_9ACAR
MSRRRRRVKIKSSSRLFAFILFNLLLLASCITAHYQPRPQAEAATLETTQTTLQIVPPASSPALVTLLESAAPSTIGQQANTAQLANNESPTTTSQAKQKPNQSQASSSIAQLQTSQQQQQQQQPPTQPLFGDESFEADRSNHQMLQFQHQQQQQHLQRDNSVTTTTTTTTAATTPIPPISSLCSMLPLVNARQLRLCRLVGHSSGADEAVALGASLGLAECRHQFRSERWNCTHAAGDHHLLTSKLAQSVGNREGGFVQAIAAAGIVHSIATACSTGSLNDCACDKTRVGPIRQRDQNWKWGGCSNNIRHGMMYARHLVELLDAVHEHHHHHMQRSLGSQRSHHGQSQQHSSISLASRCHQLMKRSTSTTNSKQAQDQQQQQVNFCQKNQNISQTIHIQLIKSLLAKNSLERHQDFRLAMNAHNNRVGRMAVAKNMEIKCRCHGLSGSCSLKTCWLKLPDFQQIGAHLKRKYESSIHLPTAINVNKLIPMMDRQEISTILQQQPQSSPPAQSATANTTPSPPPAIESSGSSMESTNSLRAAVLAPLGQGTQPAQAAEFAAWSSEAPQSPPVRLNYYERHKQLEQRSTTASQPTTTGTGTTSSSGSSRLSMGAHMGSQPAAAGSTTNQHQSNTTSLYLHGDEIPVQIAPMSQQQYQTLLRELKLCNGSHHSTAISTKSSRLSTRELQHQQNSDLASQCYQWKQQQLQLQQQQQHQYLTTNGRKMPVTGGSANSLSPLVAGLSHPLLATGPQTSQKLVAPNGAPVNQLQPAQTQLSHLLHWSNRDELVHLHRSPDYCEPDLRHGFAGVQARLCSQDPKAPDSCDRLCCGRGYERREIELRYNCDCKFQYCCKIHCNVCQKTLVEYVCK